ncbi:glycosyltransferase family 4 protein [Thermomicrobium sp.]
MRFPPASVVALDGRLLAYRRGGISRYIAELGRALARAESDSSEVRFRLVVNRVPPDLPLPSLRVMTPPHHRLETWILGCELAFRSIRVYHATDFVLPRLPPWIRGVTTIHDLAFLDAPGDLTPSSFRYYRQTLARLRAADRIIVPSEATARRLQLVVPETSERIRVIYHGVHQWGSTVTDAWERSSQILMPRLGPRIEGRPLLLAVGTIEPRKRYDLLLKAFSLLRQADVQPAPLLVIVGQEGWQCTSTVQQFRVGERERVLCWLSDIDDEDLHALYSVASALIVASRDEGFCLPAAEAMAHGVPVVAFAVGALPEIVGDAGLLIREETAASLAGALVRLLSDTDLRAELAYRARLRAQRFSWEESCRRTLAVYQEVLARDF